MSETAVVFTGQSIEVEIEGEYYIIRQAEPKGYDLLKKLYARWESHYITEPELLERARQARTLSVFRREQ